MPSEFILIHPFPKPIIQQPTDPDFLKKLKDSKCQFEKSLDNFSSTSLKQKNYKDWKWRNRLKSGMFVDAYCTSRYSWHVAKIIEELEKCPNKNVLTVRFYLDDTKKHYPRTLKTHIQRVNRYKSTIMFSCSTFLFFEHSDLEILLIVGEDILMKNYLTTSTIMN